MMRRSLLGILRAGLAVALLLGCAERAGPPPRSAVSVGYYYGPSPYYYDRHVVYYDASGRPIYFVAGVWYRVPAHYPHHGVMVRHYQRRRDEYRHHPHERRRYPPRQPSRTHRERPPRGAH
jgi:hypothetical protein